VNDLLLEVGMNDYVAEDGDRILLYFTKDFMAEFAFDGDWGDAADADADTPDADTDGTDTDGADTAWDNPFTDVGADDWFYGSVQYVYEAGLMLGTGGGVFSPDQPINRAMMATILYRYEGCPEVTHDNPYTDVAEGQWYTDAVIWLYEYSVAMDISATDVDEFNAEENVSQYAFMDELFYYLTMKGAGVPDYDEEFDHSGSDQAGDGEAADAQAGADITDDDANGTESALYKTPDAIDWANELGLMPDTGDAEMPPDDVATRAWTATVFMLLDAYINS